MNFRTTAIAASALFAMTAPAFAGGFATPEPAPFIPAPAPVVVAQPELSWTGFSAGVRLGYGNLDVDGDDGLLDDDGDDDDDDVLGLNFGDDQGAIYGFGAAYDYDFGRFVAGVGASVDKFNAGVDGVDADAIGRVGGRLGVDFGSSLVYGTAGYAKLWTDGGGAGDSDGYYAGIGSELRLTDTTTLGAEILYHEFDDFDVDSLEVDATTANLSLNLRF